MSLSQIVAEQLNLDSCKENEPRASRNGVTSFTMKTEDDLYDVFVVKETGEEQSLRTAARLAGFYNTRFFYEFVQVAKVDLPVGKLKTVFNIEDGEEQIAVFVIESIKGHSRSQLSLEKLNQVAETLARLHAIKLIGRDDDFKKTVQENHEVVHSYQSERLHSTIQENVQCLANEFSKFFKKPELIVQRINAILEAEETEKVDAKTQVLCHGNLTSNALRFNKLGALTEIVEWDNVHFGSPAADLANLIITSASTSIRRNHFMKVFRTYFYTLVDILVPKFKLADLKQQFKTTHKKAVLNSIDSLVSTLESKEDEIDKKAYAERWETTLEDAFEFESGDYISDDEHCFFSK